MAYKKISTRHWIFVLGAIIIVLWGISGPKPLYMAIAGFNFWVSLWVIKKEYGLWGLIGYFAFSVGFLIGMLINITLSLEIPWQIRLVVSILAGFSTFEVVKRWDLPRRVNKWWVLGCPLGLWIGFGLLNKGSLQDETGFAVPIGIGIGIFIGKILPWLRELRWEKESEPERIDTNIE